MSQKVIRIETEEEIKEVSLVNDYNSGLLRAQLSKPLVEEAPDGELRPALLDLGRREGDNRWSFLPGPACPDELCDPLVAIAESLVRLVRDQSTGLWLGKIVKSISADRDGLTLETRFPVASLPHVLTAPSLSLRNLHGERLGDFTLDSESSGTGYRSLYSRDGSLEVRLVETENRWSGRDLFETNDLDVCWGVGLPKEFYENDPGPFVDTNSFDIHYVLTAGEIVPREVWDTTRRTLADSPVEAPYLVSTASRLGRYSANWLEERRTASSLTGASGKEPVPLYYSNYAPNEDLARFISALTRGRLVPQPVAYSQMASGRVRPDGICLSLRVPLHSGPLGAFPESLSWLRSSTNRSPEDQAISSSLREAWALGDRDISTVFSVEQEISRRLRQMVIGRLRTRFRTRLDIRANSLGIFKFQEIT